jgi:Coenzyme PQQ synthesis protein D (PqqD)
MLTLRENVVHTETEYGAALLDSDSGEYWTLNPSGALVVQILLGGGSTAEAVQAVSKSYQVDATIASRDVDTLLADLRTANLVMDA